MGDFAQNLRSMRKERGLTLDALAEKVGTTKQVLSRYENGERVPKISMVEKLATTLGVSIAELTGTKPPHRPDFFPASAVRPLSELYHQRVPMIGSVAAGEPIMGEELGVYVEAPVRCDAAVTVSGDSMEPTYKDGDVLYIRQQPEVLNGQVAVVFVDDLAAIKHVYREHDGVMLVSDNPAYPPMRYRFGDNADAINIFGIPIGFTRMFTR